MKKVIIYMSKLSVGGMEKSLIYLINQSNFTKNYEYNGADVAWMLASTALVLIMTPGLAYFYGGMVKKKNVISTMLQSFISMAVVAVLWVVFGFSLVGLNVASRSIINDIKQAPFFQLVTVDEEEWLKAQSRFQNRLLLPAVIILTLLFFVL